MNNGLPAADDAAINPHPGEENAPPPNDAAAAAAVVPEANRLESLEHWLQLNGLPAPRNAVVQEERWERVQDRQRVEQERAYQQAIHDKVFVDDLDAQAQQAKLEQLQAWKGRCLTITCQDAVRLDHLELAPLATACDFIYALASTWRHFHPETEKQNATDESMTNNSQAGDDTDDAVELSLPDFTAESVQIFVDIVNEKQSLHDITSGSEIVDVCRIAHFLQNADVLQETVQILLQSIDTANCLAITQLADQLHLPRLYEAALRHMMQSVHNLSEGECWDHLTPELRERIGAIQSAIQCSIHDQRSALYFGSLQEYLAIFSERVHYYKERLAEAMEQQAEREQSPAWHDTQRKIDRQRTRLHTLQVAFQEQKKLFGRSLS
eukprot:CAMPEP_0117017382 /NCGR_PEP_ID=MMETSP0472-20121206/13577_1 /TAXON_ID=693140 ORGANISM="Tiarina fusus, Strain LIS" /NCGR_SAMPLE_ID=MMETSP0472 /ASSEMBLY_ACC=CAM_ASM_000603 /LENGTH=380 /DNA_ID=CAMNT_0004721725 /DNA_START=267 /DNA_END=1409 /DNA_ORIENTATION=+